MVIFPSSRQVDPDYFSLRTHHSARGELERASYPDDPLSEVGDPDEEELIREELRSFPEAVKAGVAVADAEAEVLAAEDAGVTDSLAMRRLDQARATERAVLVQLQKARAVAHIVRTDSRPAQVIAMWPQRTTPQGGGEAA